MKSTHEFNLTLHMLSVAVDHIETRMNKFRYTIKGISVTRCYWGEIWHIDSPHKILHTTGNWRTERGAEYSVRRFLASKAAQKLVAKLG